MTEDKNCSKCNKGPVTPEMECKCEPGVCAMCCSCGPNCENCKCTEIKEKMEKQ